MKILLIIFLIPAASIFTQESSSPYSVYFYLQGSSGTTETKSEYGKTDIGKAGFEYRPWPFLGLGLSYSETGSHLKTKKSSSDLVVPYFLIQSDLSKGKDTQGSILFFSMIDFVNTRSVFNFHYNTGGIDLNFHLNGDNTVDPYIGFSAFGGNCIGKDTKCDVKGGEGRFGIQFNFDNFFFYIQAQRQQIAISGNGKIDASVNLGSAGMGVRF